MKLVIQRVKNSKVEVHHAKTNQSRIMGKIEAGLMVLVGFARGDTKEKAALMAKKLVAIRLFPDDQDWSKNVVQKQYKILLVSQFTLLSRLKGSKPDHHLALNPLEAKELYYYFVNQVRWEYQLLAAKIPSHPETLYNSLIKPICYCGNIPYDWKNFDSLIDEHFESDDHAKRYSADTAISHFKGLEIFDHNEHVQTTQFGSYMSVHLINDGPVTLIIESNPDPPPALQVQTKSFSTTTDTDATENVNSNSEISIESTAPLPTKATFDISIESTAPLPPDILDQIDSLLE